MISRVITLSYFKMLVFNKKIMKYGKKQESMAQSQKNLIETIPEGAETLNLLDKVKVKELKEPWTKN